MSSPADGKRPTHGFTLTSQSSIRNPQVSLNTSSTEPTATSVSIKKETPIAPKGGKATNAIVEAGQEHTGRWTREEHEAFLQALQQYGKEWKKVAAKVKTRTVVQTRTHAQKYFQKLQKGLANDKGDVEMGTVAEAKKILPIASARRGQNSSAKKKRKGTSLLETAMSTQKRQSVAATQAAAQLMTQMSQVNTNNEEQAMVSPQTIDKQQVQYVRHEGGVFSNQAYAYNATIGTNFAAPMNTSPIKIIAPRPEHTMKKNMFPEPSPAACGKRKAIELAAAQMLAGVAASSVLASAKTTPPPTINATQLKKTTLEQVNAIRMGTDGLQIINPDNLGVKTESNQRSSIGKEPTTPWDCELEALVSEVNSKAKDEQAEIVAASTTSTTTEVEKNHHYTRQPSVQTAKRSTLHTMVRKGMLLEVETLLKSINWGKENVLLAVDSSGFSPLHSAVSLTGFRGNDSVANLMTRLLICAGASVMSLDVFGNSPLHWAARVGNAQVAEMLAIENCPLDLRNDMGETALHWAMRAGRVGLSTTQFLLANGARSALFTKHFKRPLDLGAEGFAGICQDAYPLDIDESKSTGVAHLEPIARLQEQRQCRANFFSHSPQSRTLVLHHSECLEHLPKSETDWEAPDRINSIISALSRNDEISIRENEVQVSQEFDRASLEFLSRVHSAEYLTFVNNLSKELEKRHNEETESNAPSVVPFTPMVQRTVMREPTVKKGSHSDTSFSAGSLRAARRAAGAIKHAVDCVLVGRNRNAFCIVRPPGHHAGINGLLDGGESCGFCIFNNVAAGAMHALSDENPRPNCERCAIVDIDVHHGNGTEEIVKKCDNPGRLFFFSVHLYDNDKKKEKSNGFKFYPGTGDEDDVAHNVINVPIAPMWKERSRQISHATSMAGNRHNTRNKSKQKGAAVNKSLSNENTIEIQDTSGSPEENVDSDKKNDANVTQQNQNASQRQAPHSFLYGTGREAYRQAIQQRLLPALRAFNPDLILISLGLDASGGDVGNARHYRNGKEVQGIDLTPDDYAWSTRKIMEVADICCQGRVVSILEGGYGSTRQRNTELESSEEDEQNAMSNKLDKSKISECALRHLQALIDPHNVERRFR